MLFRWLVVEALLVAMAGSRSRELEERSSTLKRGRYCVKYVLNVGTSASA